MFRFSSLGAALTGPGLRARVFRGGALTVMSFGTGQFMRLVSNLVLTRLLFPEAFGMMAIVQVFLVGMAQFSDTGLNASVMHHSRGDDPSFLNTVWTVQVIRGVLLWIVSLALAVPVAHLYNEPLLAQILPVSALSLLAAAFLPTALATADRHIRVGRPTLISLGSQALGLVIMALLAWQLRSVWALVWGSVISGVLKTIGLWLFLPNAHNRFHLERDAFRDIFHFGKFIFLSTAAGFLIGQGDRAILGLYIPLADLGVYNIAYFMATLPMLLGNMLQRRIIWPLYRMKPIAESPANRATIFRARRLLAIGMLSISAVLAFIGPWLIDMLYDPRYIQAGPMITLYSLSLVPVLTLSTVNALLPGSGDSRRLFLVQLGTAVLQTGFLFLGIFLAGIPGAIIAIGLAILATYPLRYRFARHYDGWDPVQDIGLTLAGFAVCGVAIILHADEILALLP